MQNWQKDRNYRKFENPDGSFTHVITIDGEDIEVTAEVFMAYSQCDRRERYLEERDVGRMLSLERFADEGITLDVLLGKHIESAEDSVLHAMLKKRAMEAFMLLSPEEQHLLQSLVIDGVTERDYATEIGLSQKGVNKRKHKILEKLKKVVLKP